ncbi:MAG: 2Fe-2S iron-sulfur cluster-binding protein [Polyangiaceae bacterium]|nr:2Fe-2S iron-sulfur cluster-binding protein [Polyangiaceae bacterium]
MPSIKLDGREVPFEKGDTIIRAAHRAGIDVPHYCWHPGLSVAANCRMCLVEIAPPPGQRGIRLDILKLDPATGKYSVDQKPKLQPACQVECADGMNVLGDSSPHVADARKAVQELLLLNHPVDCPICDQAGECRLQDYWLEHGRHKKRMHDEIVHKPKAQSFGPTIVYDAERCIVCTRCVRFVDEIAKDPVLDKRERGNLSEITLAPGRQLDNNYTLMTEHVCPVGALTAKDFRFKARVWFLRSARTVCQGCATGCNAYLDYDPRSMTAYRHRPRENLAVNQYWMCDVGMLSYRRAHEARVTHARLGGKLGSMADALEEVKRRLGGVPEGKLAVVLSAQHSSEDNFALARLGRDHLRAGHFFVSGLPHGAGDGILYHPDKNPNTAGAKAAAGGEAGSFDDLLAAIGAGRVTHVLALGAEIPSDEGARAALGRLSTLVTVAAHEGPLVAAAHVALPATTWAESAGTYVNAKDMAQKSEAALRPRGESRPAWEWTGLIAKALGLSFGFSKLAELRRAMTPSGVEAAATDAVPVEVAPPAP